MRALPFCSVVVPCRNEVRTIDACLSSLLGSDYPADRLEIVVVDGASTDGTRDVLARHAAGHAMVTVLTNPNGVIPVSMNMGIRHSRGAVVLKADAHTIYPPEYISRSVRGLMESGADNVGGVLETCASGESGTAVAIARVLAHPFGSGNSRFRIGADAPREADTVAFGCYRREALERVGGYNESLVRSSDMDLNTRLRRAGGRIVLLPDIRARYYPRAAFWSFAVRNLVDGFWATYPLKYGGEVLRMRHAVPLASLALCVALLTLAAPFPPAGWALAALFSLYAAACAAASVRIGVAEHSAAVACLAAAVFVARHGAYALGSAWGLVCAVASREFWRSSGPAAGRGAAVAASRDDSWQALVGADGLTVVIPAFNEARRLPPALDAIDAYLRGAGVPYELIVVDDGSTDGTAAVAEAMGRGRTNLKVIRFPENRGKGAAVTAGMLAGSGRVLMFTDADQSTSIDQLPALLQPLVRGFDMAMGSRGLAGSAFVARQRWYRRKLGDAFGVLARLILVRGFRDCQCGFKAFSRQAARRIFTRVTSPTAIFDVEVVLLCAKLGLRIAEVPVTWKHDPDSRLTYNARRAMGVLLELLRLRRHWRVILPPRAAVTSVFDRDASSMPPVVMSATRTGVL